MGDNIHKSYKKTDPSYYQSGQDWSNYTQSDLNYRQEGIPQERMQYSQYDPNYINYKASQAGQKSDQVSYQSRQNEMGYSSMYDNYPYNTQGDQMAMMYSNDQQMSYNNSEMSYYNRDSNYYQPRATMAQNYIKPEHRDYNTKIIHPSNMGITHTTNTGTEINPHTNSNVSAGMSPSSTAVMSGNVSYVQSMGYYTPKNPDGRLSSGYKDIKYDSMRYNGSQQPYSAPDIRYASGYQANQVAYTNTQPGYSQPSQSDSLRYPGEDVRFNPAEMYVQQGYGAVDMRYNPSESMRYASGYGTSQSPYGQVGYTHPSQTDLRGSQSDMPYVQHNFNDGRYIRDVRPEAPDIGYERPYLPSTSIFKPSLSFKEVATAMLSMDSGRKPPTKKTAPRVTGSIKKVSKTSKESADQKTSSKNSEGSQVSDSSGKDSKGSKKDGSSGKYKSDFDGDDGFFYRGELHSTIRTDPEYSKYRNRGLQQLSQYNAMTQFHNAQVNYYNNYIQQNMGNMVTDMVNNVSSMLASGAQSTVGGGMGASVGGAGSAMGGGMQLSNAISSTNMAISAANMAMTPNNINSAINASALGSAMRKDWIPIRKINPNLLTPSARFFPPTSKALSSFRNDNISHKLNVVEEINVENELLRNLKKTTISSACSMMESFQQSYSNKRKRIKNCLVEDCRHVIGEQPKIDVQFTYTDDNGKKKYHLNEVLSTLLPYHLFYYDKVKKVKLEKFDYSKVSEQISQLKQRLTHMAENKDSILLQSVYPCVKEGLVTCNEMAFNLRGEYDSY